MKIKRLGPQFARVVTLHAGVVINTQRIEVRCLTINTPTCFTSSFVTIEKQAASWHVECSDSERPGISWDELDRLA